MKVIFFKLILDELKNGNILLEEVEKIKSKERDLIESRISQLKGEFIKI